MWYLIYRRSKLMGTTQSIKDARRIAYRYCTKAYPRINIYEQEKEWGGRLHEVKDEYLVKFDTLYYNATHKKKVMIYTDYEDSHGLNGRQIYPTGDFYSQKSKPIKKTRAYKTELAKFKSGELSPFDLLMGTYKQKRK